MGRRRLGEASKHALNLLFGAYIHEIHTVAEHHPEWLKMLQFHILFSRNEMRKLGTVPTDAPT
jgi:hypothetical protein